MPPSLVPPSHGTAVNVVAHPTTDFDFDGQPSPIEIVLDAFQFATTHARILHHTAPTFSAKRFVASVANVEALVAPADDLLAALQLRLELAPDDRTLWLASWSLWELRLELAIRGAPYTYDGLVAARATYYAPTIPTESAPERRAFAAYAGIHRARLDFASRIKLMHTGTIDDRGRKNHLRAAFEMSRHLLDLRAASVDGQPGHTFLQDTFRYPPHYLWELSMAQAACPWLLREEEREGRSPPFSIVGDARRVLDCFGPVTIGQIAAAAKYVDMEASVFQQMMTMAAALLSVPPLQDTWDATLAQPDRIDDYWDRSLLWIAVADDRIVRERLGPLLGAAQAVSTALALFASADPEPPLDQIKRAGLAPYAHRVESAAELARCATQGVGAEIDITVSRDGDWVVYHEPTLWGVNADELATSDLLSAGIQTVGTLRTGGQPVIFDIKTDHFHREYQFTEQELCNLLTTLKTIGATPRETLIDSVNPNTLQQLRQSMDATGTSFRLGYVVIEFAELRAFAEATVADPTRAEAFDTLLVYWYQYAKLRDTMGPATIAALQQKFQIIVAENDLTEVTAGLNAGLPAHAVISAQVLR